MATLASYQAVDFDDLIRLPVQLFQSNETVRDKWQRKLRYLLVDEYQDTNTCQYELVKLLVTGVGKKPMFTAVGDDDQAIYAWRGATIENLRTLQVDFPDLKVIKLEQNYRSSTRILQAANSVIANNPKLFEKALWSEHGLGDPVKVLAMQDDEHEADQVAIMLSAHRFERRGKFSDYAILYRGNHQARVFEQALRRERIPYVMSGGQSFFDRAEIKDIIELPAAGGQFGRRPGLHPRGHHAQARRRQVDAGSAGQLCQASGSARCSRRCSRAASRPGCRSGSWRRCASSPTSSTSSRRAPHRPRRDRGRSAGRHDEGDQLRSLPVRRLRRPRRPGQVAERDRLHQLAEGERAPAGATAPARKRACST